MTKDELYTYFVNSKMFEQWHWYSWHFEFWKKKEEHPFASSIVDALLNCESKMPSFAKGMADEIAAISGLEKNEDHYEQLLQRLSEILIINQLVLSFKDDPVSFDREPTSGTSKKNPEITISTKDYKVGIEVKAPSLLKHQKIRANNKTQVASRFIDKTEIDKITKGEVTTPRDNPIKDFLISADQKFKSFKENEVNFRGLLVVVWDDFIYEPISALTHHSSGLFTKNSFAKDKNGQPLTFSNVDAVIIVRHLHQFNAAASGSPLIDNKTHAMDYGEKGNFPPKAFIVNPHGSGMSETIIESLQAFTPCPQMGAEYMPKELIWWIPT